MSTTNNTFIVTDAFLFDGSGTQPFHADVIVENGRFADIAPAGTLHSDSTPVIDANGLTMAPGFINAHSHSDGTVFLRPEADSAISQGITTEIIGNCGDSDALSARWKNFSEYVQAVNNAHPAVNIISLAGHNTLRSRIIGRKNRYAEKHELDAMKALLDDALQQGAAGLSSGLWYIPGKYSHTSEIQFLGTALRGTNKPYVTHMRSEGESLLAAVDEAIKVAEAGARRLQISHIKTSFSQNWNKINDFLRIIGNARARGISIFADRYPYIYSGTSLRMLATPPWNLIENLGKYIAENPEKATEFADDLDRTKDVELDWKRVILTSSIQKHSPFFGCSLYEIAQALNLTPGQATAKLLSESPWAQAAFGKMCEENLETFLSLDWVAAGNDSSLQPFAYSDTGRGHPRAFGTFPEFFQRVRCLCGDAEAIRRMTSLSAYIFNIPERGLVKPGYIADFVLFNPDEFIAKSTFKDPHAQCTGIQKVFVEGKLAFSAQTPAFRGRHGRFIPIRNILD